jgi:peptide/nickel transport system substrate-binding protein
VKPSDYKLYTDGAAGGAYTLYDLGPSLTTTFFWFNLNRGHVNADRYHWFSNRAFRRAVSHAIDRDAMIRGPFFGEAMKNWSHLTESSHAWHPADLVHHDHDPAEARRLLDSLGYRDRDGDGMREDDHGKPIRFSMKTNSDNNVRVALLTLIQDDLAKVGIRCTPAPVQLNTATTNVREDFDYDAMLLGLGGAVPADPAMTGNFLLSSGASHYWHVRQPQPATAVEREIDRLYRENVGTTDSTVRETSWRRIAELLNEEDFVIWLPVQKIKIPIRNGFGNIHPTVLPHRILWNIDRVFVKNGKHT